MQPSQRLKWIREKGRYAAYPIGRAEPDRCAAIWPNTGRSDSWAWTVNWDGWFQDGATCDSKQEAADAATLAWWKSVATPIPRDVEGEIAVLVARAPVMPPPNHLMTEESGYLVRLSQALAMQYAAELRSETLPVPIRNLMEGLSAELFRRRLQA